MQGTTGLRRIRRAVALLAAASMVATGVVIGSTTASAADLPSPPPLLQRDQNVVTSDPIPTVQIDNGYVWAQATIGSTVYAVGRFDNARAPLADPGTSLTPRSNVLAYNINTGALLPFAPTVNGVVKAVAASADGTRIYIGGSFNNVNGQSRWNFAALDAVTGQLVPGFNPSIGGSGVYALSVDATAVYAGGLFTQANGTARKNLASFNVSNGSLRPWAPETDLQVDAMVMDPAGQKVIVAGRFSQVNGNGAMRGTAAVFKDTGAVDVNWALPQTVKNGLATGTTAGKAGIFGLAADNGAVYGTGWVYANAATGNLEGTFAAEADTGAVRWIADCLGDHYGVYSTGTTVYTTSHTHACSTMNLHPEQNPRTHTYIEAVTADVRGTLGRNPHAGATYQNWEGTPGPSAYAWYPDFAVGTTSGLGQAGLSITGVGNVISVAGEFRSVNNGRFEGIVRFSTTPPGGAKDRPRLSGASWVATATSQVPGRVRVGFPANWDRDDLNLTYELRRVGTSTPIATVTAKSTWWNRPGMVLEDLTATPGQAYTYTVVARDGDGNASTSQSVTVTVADGPAADYVTAVLADNPQLYYPLGSVQQDWAGGNNPVFGSGVTAAVPGIQKSATGFSNFSGSSNGIAVSSARVAAPAEFSTELWFRATSGSRGKLIGYGNAATGNSGSYDRHIYMRTNGQLVFGVYPGQAKTIQSPSSYQDGQWHHVVATQSSEGIRLFVDGQAVATDPTVTTAENYLGYWRIGGDNLGSWPNVPSSSQYYFNGAMDEVAVYPYALSPTQVRTHFGIGMGFEAPTAAFTATAEDLSVSLDASESVAAGAATIASYSWEFGDGSPVASGPTVTHSYGSTGTYPVTLTVVDSNGMMSTVQQQVSVLGPNQLPVASFATSTVGLTATADATESVDSDGTIVSYEWQWGDGESSVGQIASHPYAAAGSYTVTLTVTDERGGISTTTHTVEVTHADPVAQFTASANALVVQVDGGASSASDGATLSYAWNWGDGTADGSGVVATHAYGESGVYTITLTVTDSLGSSHSVSDEVEVNAEVFAAVDSFSRTVTNGWGAADIGGVWAPLSGTSTVLSVAGGAGRFDLVPGSTREVALQGVSLLESASTIAYTLTAGPASGATYVGLGARQTAAGSYRAVAWHRNDGATHLILQRNGVAVASVPLAGGTWSSGSTFHIAFQVEGTAPATLRMKVWAEGTPEPSSWQLTTTDATPALQVPGRTTVFHSRASSGSGSNPVVVDNLAVKDLGGPVAPNTPPVASFTASVTNLSVSVNGAGSSDSDGSIVSYGWTFGDGGTGSTVTATHSYASAGTYPVTLTVTDDDGATHSVTQQVTVASDPGPDPDPEPEPPIVEDGFDRTATAGWGTAEVGGAWSIIGGAASAASVSDGAARFTLAPGGTRFGTLDSTTVLNSVIETEFQITPGAETGGTYVGVVARQVGANRYLARVWLRPDGSVWLVIHQGSTTIATQPLSGVSYSAGTSYKLKVSIVGLSPTTISAKFWASAAAEPGWQITATDNAGALQAGGSIGLTTARAGSATSAATVSFESIVAKQP